MEYIIEKGREFNNSTVLKNRRWSACPALVNPLEVVFSLDIILQIVTRTFK